MNNPRTMLTTMALLCALAFPVLAQEQASQVSAPRARFDEAISAFLEADKTNPPPKGAILFIGSSIFRQWAKLKEHMAPLPVFNRAFGGSQTSDILYHMDKVVLPYEPKVIVYYCGSNDINANHKAPAIADRFRQFVTRVRAQLPQTRILYVAINRAPQKEDKWAAVDAANGLIKAYCESDKRLGFIDVNPALFDKEGKPRLELYQPDKLHFLETAYDEFAAIIKPIVTKTWAQVGTK